MTQFYQFFALFPLNDRIFLEVTRIFDRLKPPLRNLYLTGACINGQKWGGCVCKAKPLWTDAIHALQIPFVLARRPRPWLDKRGNNTAIGGVNDLLGAKVCYLEHKRVIVYLPWDEPLWVKWQISGMSAGADGAPLQPALSSIESDMHSFNELKCIVLHNTYL